MLFNAYACLMKSLCIKALYLDERLQSHIRFTSGYNPLLFSFFKFNLESIYNQSCLLNLNGFKAVSDWPWVWQEGYQRGGAYDKIGEAQQITACADKQKRRVIRKQIANLALTDQMQTGEKKI